VARGPAGLPPGARCKRKKMAKIKTLIDSLDEVDEGLRDSYRLVDDKKSDHHGKYVLAPDSVGGFEVINPAGLKTALVKERSEASDLRTKFKAFEGLDASEARSAMKKLKEFEGIDPEKEADRLAQRKFESLEKQLLTKHAEEMKIASSREDKLKAAFKKTKIHGAALAEITAAGGNPDLLLLNVTNQVRLKEVENDSEGTLDYEAEVIGEDGYSRINGDSSKMSIKDLVAEMKASDKYGDAFKAPEQSGGNTEPNQSSGHHGRRSGGSVPNDWGEASKSTEDMVAFIDQKRQNRG